jgi:arylsulfatase A-like enzyme
MSFAFVAAAAILPQVASAQAPRPNVVVIMTDNHGAWTLGCYGNKDIRTPHIDRLAAQGLRFTRCYSSNAVCSPTRATFLTGLIPSQHGIHCYLRANEFQVGPQARCLIDEFETLPAILARLGYTCGLVGKWHLGGNETPQQGFTTWVTMPHGHTTTFHDAPVIEDGKTRKEATYLTDFWTDRAVRFLEDHKQRPFFLFLAYNGPYGLGKLLTEPARNRHAAYYAEQELKSFPRETPHPWLFNNREYINNPVAMRRYAAEISGVDDGVGRVLDTLRRLDLDSNTLVVFTADQGLAGGQGGFWGMGDHTRPLTGYDWTTHVPLIFRHGPIPAGKTSDLLVSNYDLLPSVLDYLGLKEQTPRRPLLPGRSFAATLRGAKQAWDDTVFFEYENVRSIRTTGWSLIRRFPDGPHELYDLQGDAGQRKNLHGQPAQAAVQERLTAQLDAFFRRYADPRYDLWRGGKSQVKRIVE